MEQNSYKVIIKPANTEKSNILKEVGQYTFFVDRRANKVEIALAITDVFDVDVVRVRILNRSQKFGRWGRKRVRRKIAYKKAIVTLAQGQKIEAFEGV
ncbi:50S ribosomal protein L23 [Anaerolineales bacterium HSG6]|nr:50S ribosomal protein L23 [Anaerolineales bacterium HSG6]MDM8530086.1 50S ribosomal protein L23 [Anaerolineales bacterium HSG25]